ncbi:MAG TPA: GAF domain-containing protein, partial [Chloroflexota bacterium]|nr:GAF domain-containing protein [Chloroflexota bacterium]
MAGREAPGVGEQAGEEVRHLRRTIRDLVAIAALPALWVGLEPESVLTSLVEALHQVVRGDWVYAVLQELDDAADSPELHVAWGDSGPLPAYKLATALGVLADSRSVSAVQDPFGPGTVRVFIAQLALEGATARLAFASREPDFPRDDEQLLINVGVNQGSIALQAARLLRARERAERALRESHVRLAEESRTVETLRRVGLGLAAELDLNALLQRVTDAATELSGAQFGAFFYNVEKDQGESYMLYTISGVPRERFSAFEMPRNTAVFEPTFRGEGVVRSDDITRDPRYGHNSPHFGMPKGHLPVRSYLAQPVVSRAGEVLGGLFFGHSDVGVFGEREEQLAAGIAAHAAITLENARLYEAERRARAEAEAAVRARDEFLGIASHELRNPLAGLKAAVQLLLRWRARGPGDAEHLDRFLSEINRAADRL